jgi:hypothetical protein
VVAEKYANMIQPMNRVVRPPSRTDDQIKQDTEAFQSIADSNLKGVTERQEKAADVAANLEKAIEEGAF